MPVGVGLNINVQMSFVDVLNVDVFGVHVHVEIDLHQTVDLDILYFGRDFMDLFVKLDDFGRLFQTLIQQISLDLLKVLTRSIRLRLSFSYEEIDFIFGECLILICQNYCYSLVSCFADIEPKYRVRLRFKSSNCVIQTDYLNFDIFCASVVFNLRQIIDLGEIFIIFYELILDLSLKSGRMHKPWCSYFKLKHL